jgi:hypothetical protein
VPHSEPFTTKVIKHISLPNILDRLGLDIVQLFDEEEAYNTMDDLLPDR